MCLRIKIFKQTTLLSCFYCQRCGEFPSFVRIGGYPSLFILDRDGKIVEISHGYSPTMEETIEEQLQKML